jgi:DeoR/GlpR family transcriptional regulator of sugar metabolism
VRSLSVVLEIPEAVPDRGAVARLVDAADGASHLAEKQRIGAAAAGLVDRGAVVGLTGGTTALEVARALAYRSDLASTHPDR